MIYFNSKYLSEKLNINAAKWKRWSREFLQPDPLGGYQSGYARQFSYKEAFRVYLAGYLIAELKFGIPEARQIMADLDPWLKKQGFYGLPGKTQGTDNNLIYLFIAKLPTGQFSYSARTVVARHADEAGKICMESYEIASLGGSDDCLVDGSVLNAKVILITALYKDFVSKVG